MKLTQEQIDFLNECTKEREQKRENWIYEKPYKYNGGVWRVNEETGLVDIDGNFDSVDRVYVYNERLGKKIPEWKCVESKDFKGIKFGVVTGYFSCEHMKLESLEGAPIKVMEDFICKRNKLTSLEGAPKEVGWDFDCSGNNLKDLKGCPSLVGRDFICSSNKIESLGGCPKEVKGTFDCSGNKLKKLKGAPLKARSFICANNLIMDLEDAPTTLSYNEKHREGGRFDCSYNQLTTLKGAPKEVRDFYAVSNPLKDLEGVPYIKNYDRGGGRFPGKFYSVYKIMIEHEVDFKEAVDIFEKSALLEIKKRKEAVKKYEKEIEEMIKNMRSKYIECEAH